jgi:hypothetical protein
MTYEEWKDKNIKPISQDTRDLLGALHDFNIDEELEKLAKQEYDLYVQRFKIGLE